MLIFVSHAAETSALTKIGKRAAGAVGRCSAKRRGYLPVYWSKILFNDVDWVIERIFISMIGYGNERCLFPGTRLVDTTVVPGEVVMFLC